MYEQTKGKINSNAYRNLAIIKMASQIRRKKMNYLINRNKRAFWKKVGWIPHTKNLDYFFKSKI